MHLRWLYSLLTLVAMSLLVVTFLVLKRDEKVIATNRLLMQARVYPYPLTSLLLETPHTVTTMGSLSHTSPRQYLVLYFRDDCAFVRGT